LHLSVRNWRNAYIRTLGSALLLFVWRYIKQQFKTWLHLGRCGESFDPCLSSIGRHAEG
jgi:hypothetical protein